MCSIILHREEENDICNRFIFSTNFLVNWRYFRECRKEEVGNVSGRNIY